VRSPTAVSKMMGFGRMVRIDAITADKIDE
jgi:hypothetical protein